MKIAIGADHAGFVMKEKLKAALEREGYEVMDEGTVSTESVDYPDYAAKVGHDIAGRKAEYGVLVCGSGIGMAIAANKVKGVRAANVNSAEEARLSREHNDANIVSVGARLLTDQDALSIVGVFLKTPFANGRHQARVEKITQLENER